LTSSKINASEPKNPKQKTPPGTKKNGDELKLCSRKINNFSNETHLQFTLVLSSTQIKAENTPKFQSMFGVKMI